MDIHSLISTQRDRYKKLPQRQQRIVQITAALLLVLLFIWFYTLTLSSHSKKPNHAPMLIREGNLIKVPEHSPLRSQLRVQTIQASNAPHIIKLAGVVEAEQTRNIAILPSLTGQLVSLNTQLGDEVKKGQVLAVMQSPAMAQAYADKIKAQSALKQATEAWNRAQKVNRAGANAIKDVEQIKNTYLQAQAEMQRAQATLEALGQNKENLLQIMAPIDGKITTLNYGSGAYITDQTTPIFYLSNIHAVWVTACVPEQSIPWVKKGQKVKIHVAAYPQQHWNGIITFTNHFLDPDTRCNKSRIALANPDERLQPNMFATVNTEIPQDEQPIVPLSALLMYNDTTSVFIETAPWTFTQRTVVLGSEDKEHVRIRSGLKPGDRIVTAGGILIND
ncbi:MAG: efflux RND transporter periplasmic adaptor subunit [Legionella sp.]|uniref:efflux RND transporter periplasmic adaptor subunit n=1 Tax=Legionella sp. TaxID=459 RepID=UPI00284C1EDC|nr:efflux RND transporter periplasmic adaptor subunit [Legionella sp.]